jgi:hypothetical protein
MCDEGAKKFYLEEHARPFQRVATVYNQLDKYRAQDDLARRRNVPAGHFLDDAQFLLSVAGGGNANRNVLAQRRAMAHGLARMGYGPAALRRALNCSAAEVDDLLRDPPRAQPHMGPELAYDRDELSPGAEKALHRSPYSDGFRTAIPARDQSKDPRTL